MTLHPAMAKAADVALAVLPDGLGWRNGAGNVLGVYSHGLLEDPAPYGKRCLVRTRRPWTWRLTVRRTTLKSTLMRVC